MGVSVDREGLLARDGMIYLPSPSVHRVSATNDWTRSASELSVVSDNEYGRG